MFLINPQSKLPLYEQLVEQLRRQIVLGTVSPDAPLPSVRQLAEDIGINMHTVNKAYSVLRQEGFVTIDRRRGAIVSLDVDKLQALDEMQKNLRVLLAKGRCKNITRQEIHDMVDEIFDGYDDK